MKEFTNKHFPFYINLSKQTRNDLGIIFLKSMNTQSDAEAFLTSLISTRFFLNRNMKQILLKVSINIKLYRNRNRTGTGQGRDGDGTGPGQF